MVISLPLSLSLSLSLSLTARFYGRDHIDNFVPGSVTSLFTHTRNPGSEAPRRSSATLGEFGILFNCILNPHLFYLTTPSTAAESKPYHCHKPRAKPAAPNSNPTSNTNPASILLDSLRKDLDVRPDDRNSHESDDLSFDAFSEDAFLPKKQHVSKHFR